MQNSIISKKISQHILMLGVYFKKDAAGGMASVVQYYEKYFEKLTYIATWRDRHSIIKVWYFVKSYAYTFILLLFNPKIKIVHIHSAADKSFIRKFFFCTLSKLFNKKVILHIHGSRFKDFYAESNNKEIIVKRLRKVDKLIVLSKSWKVWFINIGVNDKNIVVLNNLVDYPQIKKVEKGDKINILFLGEIGYRKGVFDIIEVLNKNKQHFQDKIILKIGGNKEIRKLITLINQYELSNFIHFEGWVSGERKIELLNWTDIFILPSFNEGLPVAILEAMSYGKAIIASPVGGIAEIVIQNQNGLLIKPGNQDEIYHAINYFIENKNSIKEFGQESFKIVESFLPEVVLNEVKKIYEQLN